MPKAVGVWREQWQICGQCGQLFPVSSLSKLKGSLRCLSCLDSLQVERRPAIITQILSDCREASNPKAEQNAQSDPYSDISF